MHLRVDEEMRKLFDHHNNVESNIQRGDKFNDLRQLYNVHGEKITSRVERKSGGKNQGKADEREGNLQGGRKLQGAEAINAVSADAAGGINAKYDSKTYPIGFSTPDSRH